MDSLNIGLFDKKKKLLKLTEHTKSKKKIKNLRIGSEPQGKRGKNTGVFAKQEMKLRLVRKQEVEKQWSKK